MPRMLELRDVVVRYGTIEALHSVSIGLAQGEIVCLIGSNGAGKSTLLNAISSVISVASGSIEFCGQSIRGVGANRIVRKGVVQVPEGRLVFRDLTVLENLKMGGYTRSNDLAESIAKVFELFPRLEERKLQLAGFLSGGEQQMLAIGRALMAEPRLLLLDEPSMGLAPLVVASIFDTLRRLRGELGLSLLLVEQNAAAALRLADRGYVLTNGAISYGGSSRELLNDRATQEAFLGRIDGANG
jgi:branched-chain amino acid transport system ATP-binding protein